MNVFHDCFMRRLIKFLGICVPIIPLLFISVVACAQGSALDAVPRVINFKDVTPSAIHGSFQLVNKGRSPIRNIALYPSCGCMIIPNNRISVLNAGEKITIPFEISMLYTGKTEETVQVIANGEPTGVSVNINAQTFVPFNDLKWDVISVPTITRLSSLQASNPIEVPLHLKAGVKTVELSSISKDMRVTSKTLGDKCIMTVAVERSAPDGDFEAGVRVKYSKGGRIGFASLNMEGVIHSKIQVQPRELNFGIVSPGKTSVSQRVVILMDDGIHGSLELRPSDRAVRLERVSYNPHKIIYALSLHPSGKGELKYYTDLYFNGEKLGGIELRVSVI